MRYVSTRGVAPDLSFDDVLLAGLASDGGLYVPESWPTLSADDLSAMATLPYDEIARRVMAPFVADAIDEATFATLVRDAYAGFDHDAVAPLTQVGHGTWMMELFHGPTLAFKDYALQLVGRLFDHVLKARGERVTIVGATSGDTGSAAIEACRDREAIDIFIFHPKGRVSEVQRRQMTTVPSANVHNIAVEGTFDDCQDLVKALFADADLRRELRLSAVNSINWARIMAQIAYYVVAAVRLGAPHRRFCFAVPTGNFGNVFAGYGARAMGLPIDQFVIGSNRNDILTRFFAARDMSLADVHPTLSPSMDIQVSSNFERLLFDLTGRDGAEVTRRMAAFRTERRLEVSEAEWRQARDLFDAVRLDDAATLAEIARVRRRTGRLVDPHSAIGLAAANQARDGLTTIALATAHPAKFPDAVQEATGRHPELPPHLADLFDRPERMTPMANDIGRIATFIKEHVRK